MKLRIATRRSKLALTQMRWVTTQLCRIEPTLQIEEVHIVTKGDRIQSIPLNKIGGKGLFVTEVESAVLDGRADLAVHSLKDMPAQLSEGLKICVVPKREDPRDILVTPDGRSLEDLPTGARVGTGSLRRRIQLYSLRSDLEYTPIRGNVDTRIRKLQQAEVQAIVLAYAGLRRLGLSQRPLWVIPKEQLIPAVGQGILALETRTDDQRTEGLLQHLDNTPARIEMIAERSFLKELGGDCNVPLAGHACYDLKRSHLKMDGMVGSVVTYQQLRASASRHLVPPIDPMNIPIDIQAKELGKEIAKSLLDQGAEEMILEAKGLADPRTAPST